MRTLARSLAFAAVLAFGTACGDNDSNAPDTSHLGTYTLQSMVGDPVPSVVFELGDFKVEAVSGTLTLNSNGTWSESTTWRDTEGGTTGPNYTTTCTGSFQRNGGTMTFTGVETEDCEAGPFAATFTGGNTITVDPSGLNAVYRK